MNPPILYSIEAARPAAHIFEVSLSVNAHGEALRFALPAWIPGSYMIREFSRHVVSIGASSGGRKVALEKIDKHTWQAAPVRGRLTLRYEVYAWDLSVRTAHLDQAHGFFNGTSVFLRVLGREDSACVVDLRAPRDPQLQGWRVATALRELRGRGGARRHGFGLYEAADYDELIDHPVGMGSFALAGFDACGVRHEIALSGKVPNVDLVRLSADLERICTAQIRFFEPRVKAAPMDRYVFLVMAVGDGYGGLEHRASTALICSRKDLPRKGDKESSEGYRGFLGLASHEYFHTWNVKRIKPAAFVPYPLDRECHTSLLWIFEGFTSYYDDLFLVRSGLLSGEQYLKSLAGTIGEVMRSPGRLVQSVAESSFDAWTKYYRQDENSPNAIVSYYAKGSLVALCLDLHIRIETRNTRSLDNVMRALWREFGRDFYRGRPHGLGEQEFIGIAERATGVALARLVADAAYSTNDLPLEALLAGAGIELRIRPDGKTPSLGIKTRADGSDLVIATAYEGGAACIAGLSAGDLLVAIDGLRVSRGNLIELLDRYAAGQDIEIHAFRRDELRVMRARLQAAPAVQCTLHPSRSARTRAWLGHWLGRAGRSTISWR